MYQFLHLRSRTLHTLILGLVALTFYAYYRTTFYDIRQISLPRNASQSPLLQAHRVRSNTTTDTQIGLSAKNTTSDSSVISLYFPHNASNLPTVTTTVALLYGGQSSSVGVPWNSKQINERPVSLEKISGTTSKTVLLNIRNDSAHAIYEAGHIVSIPEKCPHFGKGIDLFVIIMSAPNHIDARTAIRLTWGHFGLRRDIGILFLLGTTSDLKLENILQQEQKTYGDIIRGKFIDSYSNLTLKTLSALEWVDTYCSQAKFFLKTDDDMFINIPRLLSFIKKHYKDKNVIFGRLARKWKPIRNTKSKYYVSKAQFKQPVFPDFTTGPAYLLTSDIIRKLYDSALDQTYLKLEDVFITGIVAHKLGIRRTHVSEFLNKRVAYNPCNIQRGISIHMVKYSEQFDLWKKLLDGKTKCKR